MVESPVLLVAGTYSKQWGYKEAEEKRRDGAVSASVPKPREKKDFNIDKTGWKNLGEPPASDARGVPEFHVGDFTSRVDGVSKSRLDR